MTDFRKKQMRKECVERVQLSLGKKITPTEASDLLAQVRARMAALRLKDPVAWDAMSKQAMSLYVCLLTVIVKMM